ncbi:MAG: hypothetical protein ACLURV_13010 [Gallintestinimicrobium sp.]
MKTRLAGCGVCRYRQRPTSGIDTEFVAADIKPGKAQVMRKIPYQPYPSLKACLMQKSRMSCISAHRTICTFK